MSRNKVTTHAWANGYGLWRASAREDVPTSGTYNWEERRKTLYRIARRRILAELREREGDGNIAPQRVFTRISESQVGVVHIEEYNPPGK